jgi:hypothetical protein
MSPTSATAAPRRSCTRSFPGRREHVRQARAFITAFLDGCPAANDAVLLASEIAANAVAHSASGRPGGTFTLRARVDGDGCLHAEVEDQGSGWDGNLGTAEAPHGLFLLRALSAACGTRRGEQGWVTWFALAVPATEKAPPS